MRSGFPFARAKFGGFLRVHQTPYVLTFLIDFRTIHETTILKTANANVAVSIQKRDHVTGGKEGGREREREGWRGGKDNDIV